MPTPSERRALLFVAAVAALGLGVRGLRSLGPDAVPADARAALAEQIASVDSAVTSGGRPRARARPPKATAQATVESAASLAPTLAPNPPKLVDLDRATEAELDALPGIGPALARRIVEDRAQHGAFGSLEALQEVRGIGPALAEKLAPFVTFSAAPRPPRATGVTRRNAHP